jgi:hypothetical protein
VGRARRGVGARVRPWVGMPGEGREGERVVNGADGGVYYS